jgi:hypothetical protein
MASPGVAYQRLIDTAYDPAAALVVITSSMVREQPSIQGHFHPVIFGIAETLDRPAQWREPFARFQERWNSGTDRIVALTRDALFAMYFLKAPGLSIAHWIREAILQHARTPGADQDYGAMLHLVENHLQKLRRSGAGR